MVLVVTVTEKRETARPHTTSRDLMSVLRHSIFLATRQRWKRCLLVHSFVALLPKGELVGMDRDAVSLIHLTSSRLPIVSSEIFVILFIVNRMVFGFRKRNADRANAYTLMSLLTTFMLALVLISTRSRLPRLLILALSQRLPSHP